MSKVDSFHAYMQATKDMAQSVVHRYHTCDEEPDVAWEIIEDVMVGLIAVFLDMFGEEMPIHKNLTESDMERDIDSLEEQFKKVETEFTTSDEYQKCVEQDEFDLFRYETVEEVERLEKEVNELKKAMWDRFNIVDGDILRISREVSDQRKSIKNLDFKNGEYDAQFINLTDEQNDLGTRLSLVEDKVRVLSQHCNIIFTE